MAAVESLFSHGKNSTRKTAVMITLPCTMRKWVSKKRVGGGRVGDAEGAVRGECGGVREIGKRPLGWARFCALYMQQRNDGIPAVTDGLNMVSAIEMVEKLVMSVAVCG